MNAPAKIKPETATPVEAPDIHGRMVAVMRELGAIGKEKTTTMTGGGNFKYRGIDDVYNAINPILAKHGVYMTAEVLGKTREERTNKHGTVLAFTCLKMRYHFRAEDGSSITTEAEGEGMDSGDKSSNKAMAVAHKYALLQAFCIPTQDLDDPDAHVHEVAAKAKPAPQTQREAIHTPMQPKSDEDILAGMRNWVDQQKDIIIEFSDMDTLDGWRKKHASHGGREGTWDRPTPGSALDKILKFDPKLFNELKKYYMEKLVEI